MTAPRWPAGAAAARAQTGGRADGTPRSAPVIVLTYPHAGAHRLRALLTDRPELVCTSGIGLLAACDRAAAAWRQAERRSDGSMSTLAASSVRALATGMITAMVARAGRPRWCETAVADRGAAETFLRLFPAARFLCLHRACPDVVYTALHANPWGVSGPGFAAYTAAYPGSTAAALAAWWCGHAGTALAFEEAHPQACLRVRYEDLAADTERTAAGIGEFLGLTDGYPLPGMAPGSATGGPSGAARDGPSGAARDGASGGDGGWASAGADAPGCGADFPCGQIPVPLLTQINALHAGLGYPPLRPDSR
ncbi:MAG TPA: sulfotransferase [Rugosimonospora sp.]|jgi:hypothetical protein